MNVHGQFVNVHGQNVNVHGLFVNDYGQFVNDYGQFVNVHGQFVNVHGQFVNVHGQFVTPGSLILNHIGQIYISHTCDKNIPFYGCLTFFCLGLPVSVLGLNSCLKLSINAIYRISGTTLQHLVWVCNCRFF